jgi:outer membrane protein
MMKKLLCILATGLLILSSLVHADDSKIAILDVNSIVQPQIIAAENKLVEKFSNRKAEIQKEHNDITEKIKRIENDSKVMKAAELEHLKKEVLKQQNTFNVKLETLQQDMLRHRAEEADKIRARLFDIAKKIADSKGYTMVQDSASVIYSANEKNDITADVIKQMKQVK